MALLDMRGVGIGFGGAPVLEGIELQIERGERIGLVGRNGVGKSTLLKIIAGDSEPDEGVIARQQGLRVAYLPQDLPAGIAATTEEVIASAFGNRSLDTRGLAARGLGARGLGARGVGDEDPEGAGADDEAWRRRLLVDTIVSRMQLDPGADFAALSAGMQRRVLLARGLVRDPDILLLDEPTNHLDIDGVAWLEDFLLRYGGTLVFVTHDRTFLRRLSTRIVEVDRARLIDWACDYDTFSARKGAVLNAEAAQEAVFDRRLAQEEAWIRQGIEARRTRNEGRVRALERLREQRRERREQMGPLRIQIQEAERSGKLVIKAKDVQFAYGERQIVRDFSTTILRGNKVGIVGPNGSGKTTLLRILSGDLAPQAGTVRLGSNLQIAYFDQLRAQLEEDRTVFDNVADGSDFVTINGRRRHVIGYLQDFGFAPERVRIDAGVLSGGERNRLLLARMFARRANLIVMDEPTNDLDLETLELLEDLLLEYEGTLLLVSHDRELLNNVVSATLALEGNGRVGEYAGGYDDWLRQRGVGLPEASPPYDATPGRSRPNADERAKPERSRGLTYRERQEMDELPARIEALEAEQKRLYAALADPQLYQAGGEAVADSTVRLQAVEQELAEAYARWEALEEKSSAM